MKYRATISLEFDAFDCPELRLRKGELTDWVQTLDPRFGAAALAIKERRPRRSPRAPAPAEVWVEP